MWFFSPKAGSPGDCSVGWLELDSATGQRYELGMLSNMSLWLVGRICGNNRTVCKIEF